MNTFLSSARALLCAFVALLLLTGISSVHAQRINALTLTTFSGGYSTIKGQSGTVTLATLSGSISGQYSMSMPFAFKYDDNLYAAGQTLYVQVAGSASFVSNTASSYNNILTYGTPSSYNSAFAVLSGLQYSSSTYQTAIYYRTTGSAPNRVLTVEWYQFGDYTTMSSRYSYQLKLYETSNTIEFLYDGYNVTTTNSSYCPSYKKGVGLNGRTTPSFLQRIIAGTLCQTPSTNYRFSALPDIQLAATPKVLNFGSQLSGVQVDLDVTIQHVGTQGLLNITSASIVGPSAAEFSIVSPVTPPTNIPIGGTVVYTVRYTAATPGPQGASLVLTSNGRDSGTQSIALSAFGIAPQIKVSETHLFKGVRKTLGTAEERSFVVTSVSAAPLFFLNYPNSFVFTGDGAPSYQVTRMPMNPLPGGMSDTLTVRFMPTVEGGQQATLTINSNAANNNAYQVLLKGIGTLPRIITTPETMIFDSVAMGESVTKKFTIYNPGSDTLNITQNFFSSSDADFTLIPIVGDDTRIPPEKSREVGVTFRPLQKGTRTARYRVMTNIPLTFDQPRQDTATTTLYYEIQGTGIPVGKLAVSLDDNGLIDSAIINEQKCTDVVITNDGDADVTITATQFTGASAADYELKGLNYPYLLRAKSSVTVEVCGTPAARGSRLASLEITGTTSEKPITLSASVDVRGLLACLDAMPPVAFETSLVPHTQTDTVDVTVTNCGDVPTTYTASFTSNTEGSYTVTPTSSSSVPAGGTATFTVFFTPTTSGVKDGKLSIASTNAGTKVVDLQGTGACAVLDAMPTVEAPLTPANSTKQFTVTINNTGNLAWDPGTPVITPADAYAFVSGAPIPAGGSGDLTFEFRPPSMNQFVAQITFPEGKECGNALTINLTGNAVAGRVHDVRTVDGYVLGQNSPNPTNGMTTFSYSLATSTNVRIVLADLTGKTIRELVNGSVTAGTHELVVNTTGISQGTYLYIMEAGTARLVRQMVVSK